ncbi:MAG: Hsp20/alpha crystallin family protein [Candidatus Rokubacteria bacterium]|nr:Hsp20/alpha crystallin family protein [Candidatus Rokubacteria bacterium]MBI2553676.1 Hsp20/alpha crystallin family protein [Candidatus Rokubacteria bacterium]
MTSSFRSNFLGSRRRESRDENYHRLERWVAKFERSVPLPMPVQTHKVKAAYREGVLEIKIDVL